MISPGIMTCVSDTMYTLYTVHVHDELCATFVPVLVTMYLKCFYGYMCTVHTYSVLL